MFWDSSALVPYLVAEEWSHEACALLTGDTNAVIWWATPVECTSALERRRREGAPATARYEEGRRRLFALHDHIDIVEPHPAIRERAIRLLALHPLRAADALQLAAALVYFDERPRSESFVCLDERLREAAAAEGLTLIPRT